MYRVGQKSKPDNFCKVLQGSAVTQTMLGGRTIYLPVANFLRQKLWKLADSRQSYFFAKIVRLAFLAHPVYGVLVTSSIIVELVTKILSIQDGPKK